jgi:hypothetical protein
MSFCNKNKYPIISCIILNDTQHLVNVTSHKFIVELKDLCYWYYWGHFYEMCPYFRFGAVESGSRSFYFSFPSVHPFFHSIESLWSCVTEISWDCFLILNCNAKVSKSVLKLRFSFHAQCIGFLFSCLFILSLCRRM